MTPVVLEIVSPERLLLSRPVEMVVIPAYEGELGVLPQHAPMIALLRGGTIRIYENNNQLTNQFFVAGGFAEITPERCTVLADEAVPISELRRSVAEERLREAEAAFGDVDKNDIAAIDAAMDRIQSARAMLEAAPAGGAVEAGRGQSAA